MFTANNHSRVPYQPDQQKIKHQIQSNDPGLGRLIIGTSYYGASGGYDPYMDWKRDGERIGQNTNIKQLAIKRTFDTSDDEFISLCDGLVCNKSITRLEVWTCGAWRGEVFDFLTPFFIQN